MAEKRPALVITVPLLLSLPALLLPVTARALEPVVLKQGVDEYPPRRAGVRGGDGVNYMPAAGMGS
jgi:hypothetical protein